MTKKKIICILVAVIVIMSIAGSVLCSCRYRQPEKKVYEAGESFVCNGVEYTLINMEFCSFYDAMSKYDMTVDDFMFGDDYMIWADNKKVAIGKIKVSAVSENYDYSVRNITSFNRFFVFKSHEYDFERKLNEEGYDTVEFLADGPKTVYVAYSLLDYAFSEKAWNNLSVDDMSVYVYDENNSVYNFMNMDGTMP